MRVKMVCKKTGVDGTGRRAHRAYARARRAGLVHAKASILRADHNRGAFKCRFSKEESRIGAPVLLLPALALIQRGYD
jgi:hypothetical protein